MALVLTWRDGTIQTFDKEYSNIEEALLDIGVRKADVMDLEYWEDTDGWNCFHPGEIDLTKLKK